MAVTKVYIDCNILIDWLLNREPFSYFATRIIELTVVGPEDFLKYRDG